MNSTLNISAKHLMFCQWLYLDGNTNKQNYQFTRKYLRAIAMKNGMAWAPAWIVKDKSRKTTRGLYSVPELVSYIELNSPNTENAQAT